MYWFYEIENKLNHKKYIGLTNNIKRREIRHFTNLKMNRHHNSFLQSEYNKDGRNNFAFTIIYQKDCNEEEASKIEMKLIKEKDSYNNGYNQNPGGTGG